MILGEIIIPETLVSNERIVAAKEKGIVAIKTTMDINPDKPTLIVGWKVVKAMFSEDEISIRNKKIRNNLFWTFSPRDEATQDFNEDTEEFISKLYTDLIADVKYHFVDPIFENFSTSEELIEAYEEHYCFENTYMTENFVYVYDKPKNVILGLDLKYLKFFNFDIDYLVDKIALISCDVSIEDYTDNGTYQKYKQFLDKDFDKKYIVYLENSLKEALL